MLLILILNLYFTDCCLITLIHWWAADSFVHLCHIQTKEFCLAIIMSLNRLTSYSSGQWAVRTKNSTTYIYTKWLIVTQCHTVCLFTLKGSDRQNWKIKLSNISTCYVIQVDCLKFDAFNINPFLKHIS